MPHIPVLLNEVTKLLAPKPGEFFIDGTFGSGGHAQAILTEIGKKGKLLGVDWDGELLAKCKLQMADERNVILIQGNYADLSNILRKKKLSKADGLLLDLGFSSEQLTAGRGFSFLADEPLLMTYSEKTRPLRERLPQLSEKELADIIYRFGGEKYARRIAKAIKEAGRKNLIRTSGELAEIIQRAVPKNYERGRINPATRTFQALRIWVNDELGNLKKVLENMRRSLHPGGRIGVISFHSLEDKIVKDEFRRGVREGWLELIVRKPVTASAEEIARNPRSRSAKFRAAVLIH